MSRYVLSDDCAADLDNIWEYIARDSVQQSDRWVARLFKAFETIALNPGLGHRREDLTQLPVLFWPVGKYLILYRVQPEYIEIVAVTQGARDIPTFLGRRNP